jgi:hypothetical protein
MFQKLDNPMRNISPKPGSDPFKTRQTSPGTDEQTGLTLFLRQVIGVGPGLTPDVSALNSTLLRAMMSDIG